MNAVYIIKAGDLFKIGKSREPHLRLDAIRQSNPLAELICWEYESDSLSEKKLHDEFKEHRVSGEWFRLSDYQQTQLQERMSCPKIMFVPQRKRVLSTKLTKSQKAELDKKAKNLGLTVSALIANVLSNHLGLPRAREPEQTASFDLSARYRLKRAADVSGIPEQTLYSAVRSGRLSSIRLSKGRIAVLGSHLFEFKKWHRPKWRK